MSTDDEILKDKRPVSRGFLAEILRGVGVQLAGLVSQRTAALEQRMAELESRVRTAETRAARMTYRGVWRDGEHYDEGAFTTDRGSLWHANRATNSRPGSDDSWTLAVKRGADGRDWRR
ncbi:MAG: hypothetical protein AB7O31_13475 [Burkholderiales bacterium]